MLLQSRIWNSRISLINNRWKHGLRAIAALRSACMKHQWVSESGSEWVRSTRDAESPESASTVFINHLVRGGCSTGRSASSRQ